MRTTSRRSIAIVTCLALAHLFTRGVARAAPDDVASPPRATSVQLDQCFIEEQGDAPRIVMLGEDVSVALETGRIRWLVSKVTDRTGPWREPAVGGNLVRSVVEVEPLGARRHRAGRRRAPARRDQPLPRRPGGLEARPAYSRRVRYAELWDGIDLVFKAEGRILKATWSLAPGADFDVLRLRHHGAESVSVDAEGRLVIETAAGPIVDAAPVAWQERDGVRCDVPVAFALWPAGDGATDVGFTPGAHDPVLPLLIDPAVVVQAGFIGGSARDEAADITVDADGNVYVCGWARSTESTFPVVVGPGLHYSGSAGSWTARGRWVSAPATRSRERRPRNRCGRLARRHASATPWSAPARRSIRARFGRPTVVQPRRAA
jgi:hypothetical protein